MTPANISTFRLTAGLSNAHQGPGRAPNTSKSRQRRVALRAGQATPRPPRLASRTSTRVRAARIRLRPVDDDKIAIFPLQLAALRGGGGPRSPGRRRPSTGVCRIFPSGRRCREFPQVQSPAVAPVLRIFPGRPAAAVIAGAAAAIRPSHFGKLSSTPRASLPWKPTDITSACRG